MGEIYTPQFFSSRVINSISWD